MMVKSKPPTAAYHETNLGFFWNSSEVTVSRLFLTCVQF